MATIASQSKGGYYPTPIHELELLCRQLKLNESNLNVDEDQIVNLIDPCCGEGEALQIISGFLNTKYTYGVELEENRAAKASSCLYHALHDGYENLRTEARFSLLWLNPPYDERHGERLEVIFLKALTGKNNVLERNGLLLFCIPQYVLKPAAAVLSGRFSDIQVFRFTNQNYPVFKQVILIGRYGKSKDSKAIYKWLRELSDVDPNDLPTLEEIDDPIKVYPSSGSIAYFRAGRLKLEEMQRDFRESPLFPDVEQKLTPVSNKARMKNPMLPLKPTHTGIAIASGAVGGNMGTHRAHCS